ncbi:TPA: hypothetical protein ACX6Q5_003247 [Photobacterium damselae]
MGGDEEEWEKREEKVLGEMRESGERGKIWFWGDEEEWEKREDKVLGEMRESRKRGKRRFGGR